MIHWFLFNSLVAAVCILILAEKYSGAQIGLLVPLAWLLLIITAVLIAKDALAGGGG